MKLEGKNILATDNIIHITSNYQKARFINNKTHIAIILLLVMLILLTIPSIANGETIERTYHRLDTGVVFVWKNSGGQWQNGWSPGTSISYAYHHTLPKDASSVEVHPFSPSASSGSQGYFDFDESGEYHWNPEFAWDKSSYLEYYYDYAVSNLTVSGSSSYNPETGNINVGYGMRLSPKGGVAYDVKRQLSYGEEGKQAIIDLLGNPSQQITDAMNLMDPSSESYDSNVEGYLYFIPIVFSYTLEEEAEEEEEPDEPQLDITGEAHLNLPEWTYEGHTVEAWDTSLFTVDGQGYSAHRMYQEKLASNDFIPGSSVGNRRTDLTTADLTFNTIGTFPVTLKVTDKNGAIYRDAKSIEVRKTPAILVNLGGVQKENRKQTLNVVVATAPLFPLETLWIEVSRESTGECVHSSHCVNGSENQLDNSHAIKTRPIQLISADPYFTHVELDFLTKNTVEETFVYKVYCTDERGHWDEVENSFIVAPDLPPVGLLSLPEEFLREKSSNESRITMEDVSRSDGDQLLRTWSISPLDGHGEPQILGSQNPNNLPGFMDESFGTLKKISFTKEGVGVVQVHLHLKDHWIEETLEEYILPSDYKEGEAWGETVVENIPPKILIEPVFAKKATVLFIATSKLQARILEQGKHLFRKLLIKREIDGDVQIASIPPNITSSGIRGYYDGIAVALPFGFNGYYTFLEDKWFSVDEENLYTINGTWLGGTHDDYPQMPYTITSRQGETGEINWTFSITEDIMMITPGGGDSFAHDDQERYLFFRYGDSTLILSKDNGSYLAKIPAGLGEDNYWSSSGGNLIYSFKSDGIYALNTGNGNYNKIYSGQIKGKTKALDGGVHFLEQRGGGLAMRGFFDLATEKMSFSRILGTGQDAFNTQYNCLGIDSNGTLIMGIDGQRSLRVYDHNNLLLKSISGWNPNRYYSVTPAYDERGVCNYITASWEEIGGSNYYYNYTGVWGVRNSIHIQGSMRTYNGFRTDVSKPMFSLQAGNYIYVQTGALWAGIYGGGSVTSHYTEQTYLCTFNMDSGSWNYNPLSDFTLGMAGEHGRNSHSLVATSYTYNKDQVETDPYQGGSGLYGKTRLRYQTLEEVTSRILPLYKNDSHIFFLSEDPTQEFYEETADLVAEGEGKYERVLALKATGEDPGMLQRTYALDPDKTYYYEYEVKGISQGAVTPVKYEFLSQSRGLEEGLSSDTYKVVHTEKEEFNDIETNPFFEIPLGRTADGQYKGANLCHGKSKGSYLYSDGSTITFNVPEGVNALLSFDYDLRGNGIDASVIYLNDKPWHKTTGITGGVGKYVCPEFLPEGENRLRFYTKCWGSYPMYSWALIDNLTCFYVESNGEESEEEGPIITLMDDGFVHGKGVLKTPPEVMAYRGFPGEYVSSNFNTQTDPRIIKNISNPDRKVLTINVPQGKFALDTAVLLHSSPSTSSSNSWDVTWKWLSHTWICRGRCEYSCPVYQIPGAWWVNLGGLQGTQTITEQARAYNWSFGDFGEAKYYEAPSKPQAYTDGVYFYELDEEGKRETMFLENDIYQGQTLFTLAVQGEDLVYWRDFQLYYIENGVKVYPEESGHLTQDFFTKWTGTSVEATSVVIEKPPIKQKETLVYQKGELVAYDLYYSDYEDDPSRREYWRYTHTPFNDGLHPDHSKVIDRSIPRFYIDGKYEVDHWQEDNPSRRDLPQDDTGHPLGYPDFNKLSNVETITFYIEGTANAPWITDIRAQVLEDDLWKNKAVDYKDCYRIQIGVDDQEKDILSLTTEAYLDRRRIAIFEEGNIKAGRGGAYPKILTPSLPALAGLGHYQVVCTVSDETGTGLGTYFFQVDRIQPIIRIHRLF